MTKMADPLKLLHEYAVGRRTMREIKNGNQRYYVFGDAAYRRDVKTNLMVYGRQNEYYTLESLLLLWENREMQHTAYVKDASGKGIQCVTRPDRRELLAYLKGEREQPPQTVDLLAPIPAPIPVSRLIDQNEPEVKKARYDGEENRQRIQNLLKGTVTEDNKSADIEGVRDLSDKLTADKIAALKNKRKKNMARNTIKSVDDRFGAPMDLDVPDVSEDAVDRELKGKERVWRNRTSVMEAASKEFTSILSILHSFKLREEAAQRQKSTIPPPRTTSNDRTRTQPAGYSRYDQEKFNKDQTAGFKIETGLTFQGTSIMSASGAKPMVVESSTPAKALTPSTDNGNPRHQKRQSRTPIIIIPAAGTSLITMFNVRDILQDMRFITTEERKTTCRRENEVLIQRLKHDGVTVPYRVVENPLKFSDDEWSRVVAVFVQGPAWQFKGWRWGGNPTDIFANVAAFHLMYDDQKTDNNVAKWSVNVLKLSRTKRHLDRAILARFWETLDRYIIKNKPHLRY
uniref:Cell division control protein 73 C-terminal domain-containing protein n=1 Tax=Onchocerca volvulus TaxID=6282 RepID=A0A8R1Y4A7_ONCVO